MKSLRHIIRNIILESQGIDLYDAMELSELEGNKRYIGAYAKKIFRKEADRNFLNSLGYIHSIPLDSLKSRLSKMRQKDELSCLITHAAYEGEDVWEVSHSTGNFMNENSVGLIIEGWVTWAANHNANTGHIGALTRKYGDQPQSGISKAPGKAYHMRYSTKDNPGGGRVPQYELDRVLMDEDDIENKGMHHWGKNDKNEWKQVANNEALVDNWTVIGVCHVVDWTDYEDTLTSEYDAKIQEAYKEIKKYFPRAELVKCRLD